MALRSLQVRSFRNYQELQLSFNPEITVFTGKNGIGKTTVLEAVSLMGSGKSFRNGKNFDFIRKGDEFAHIAGEITDHQGLDTNIKIHIYPQGKKIYRDDKLVKSTASLLEYLPTIVFSPADHQIIDGESADRKQFLNRAAASVDWEYLEDLQNYTRVLTQRNRILKDSYTESWSQNRIQDILASWDEQLIHFGSRLLVRRHYFLTELAPFVAEEYRRISLSEDKFDAIYQPWGDEDQKGPETEDEAREMFTQKLLNSFRRDLASGSSQVGPHKDEILLTLNGNKVKFYASQGEKRTCALALRLGELTLFRRKLKKAPMLLFDDVSSELDQSRRHSLVELLRKENTQVFITATELPVTLLGDIGKNFEHLDLNAIGVRS